MSNETAQKRAQREKYVRMAIGLTEGTAFAVREYERHLLDLFIDGELSIQQVIKRLDDFEASNTATRRID